MNSVRFPSPAEVAALERAARRARAQEMARLMKSLFESMKKAVGALSTGKAVRHA